MKKITGNRKTLLSVVSLALLTLCAGLRDSVAGKLNPSNWLVYNYSGPLATNGLFPPTGLSIISIGVNNTVQTNGQTAPMPAPNQLTNLTDNNPATFATLSNPSVLVVDLGQTCVLDRVYLIGSMKPTNMWPNYAANQTNPPLGLIVVYVGNTSTTTNQVAAYTVPYDAGNPVETEADLRFSPAAGRYVRLELHTKVTWGNNYWPGWALNPQPPSTNVSWNVGELEFYGFSGSAATQTNVNAVVLPVGAAPPLALAASDLSYYLGELTGLPHPIIPLASVSQFSGTLYQIVDLASLAPSYSVMMSNIANGTLSTNISVTNSGRTVIFSSWPYRTVLWSVWDFLEKQGIRWVYPDAHGDYVPTNGLNLSVVPFQDNPPTYSIYANFQVNQLEPWPNYITQSVRQEYLYPMRNRWTCSQEGYCALGGAEIPAEPPTGIPVNSQYTEGFLGYPENFSTVIPNRILDIYSNWWGWATTNPGSQVNPATPGAPAFTMDDPTLINWVASKMTNIASAQPLACSLPLNLYDFHRPYNLLPNDATTYSQDPVTLLSNGPPVPNPVPYVKEYNISYSGMYYSFVTAVANQVQQMGSSALVGALAYADVFLPPTNLAPLVTFPTNVQVQVCLYGSPNLPMTAPPNQAMKAALDGWHATCSHLTTYDYALLHTDAAQPDPRLPVPLVAASLARSQYLASIGALDGGCQANLSSLPYNPWNFYAYPRARWNPNQTAAQIEQEFFTGYFHESAAPMLAYYQALENYQQSNNVNMYYSGYAYGITPGSFPLAVLAQMETNIVAAQQSATNWWVVSRVAEIADGFNWVVTNSGLSETNLSNISGYPIFDNTQTNLNLAQFIALTNSYILNSGGSYMPPGSGWVPTGGWAFFSAGYIKETLNFTVGGTYQVVVNARGVPAQGINPIVLFYTGPNEATWTISSTNYANYTTVMTIPPGVWDVIFFFENSASGGTRNVFVDGIQLVPQ